MSKQAASSIDVMSPAYWGVLASSRDLRVILTARRATYCVQRRVAGLWHVEQSFPSSFFLFSYLAGIARNVPPRLVAAAQRLPHDPADCDVRAVASRPARRSAPAPVSAGPRSARSAGGVPRKAGS